MEIKDLIPVDYANQRVLTTAQLAEYYQCATTRIKDNFRKTKERFIEGEHYFKVQGEALKQLKESVLEAENFRPPTGYKSPLSGANCSIILWTAKGAARHCKMLNTQKAWEVFNALEQNYFNPPPAAPAPVVVEEPKKRKSCSDTAHAYAFLMSNATTKIGHSDDIEDRIKRMKREKGLEVMREHHSPKLPRDDARSIEKTLHKKYARFKVDGEFFNADYADVCNSLDRATAEYSEEIITVTESSGISDYERARLLVDLCNAPVNSPLVEQLFKETANLLLGKKLFQGD